MVLRSVMEPEAASSRPGSFISKLGRGATALPRANCQRARYCLADNIAQTRLSYWEHAVKEKVVGVGWELNWDSRTRLCSTATPRTMVTSGFPGSQGERTATLIRTEREATRHLSKK